jgi:hypothetical protein
LHTRNQENDALGLHTGNMDTRWVPQCIITDVKMYTYQPRPVNASRTVSSSFPTIIKCNSYRPPTDCSWQPKTWRMLYKILIQKHHSLASGMTPYRHLVTWRKKSNSNYDKPRLPRLKLCLPRCSNEHALLNHQIKPYTLPLFCSDKRYHRQQFTHKTSNAPIPPRVVTPRTLHPSPPRVPTRSQRLSPRNLSQDDLCGMNTDHMAITIRYNHWSR